MQENWIGRSKGLQHDLSAGPATRPPGCADGARGLHHPARHPVRRQLRGRRARPSAGRGRRRRATRRSPPSSPSAARAASTEAEIETGREDRLRHRPDGAASVRPGRDAAGLDRQLHPDRTTARAPSSAARPTTSATSTSPANTTCRSSRWCCRRAATGDDFDVGTEAYVGPGTIFNSDFLDGLDIEAAKAAAIARIEAPGQGEGATVYRLRDWGVSRQRYWGCPIPVIHCAKCGAGAAFRHDQLPVVLPDDVDLRHARQSAGPPPDLEARRPARPAAATAVRETDTLDTFVDSVLVLRPLRRSDGGRADRQAPPPTTGCRSTSISAASSTRSCTCSTPASSPAPWRTTACCRCASRSPACSPRAW